MNNLNIFFGEEVFLKNLDENFKFREVVFLCENKEAYNSNIFNLKRRASKSVVIAEDKKSIYFERVPLVVLCGNEEFLKEQIEFCNDAKKPYFLLFTSIFDFAHFDFNIKKEENVFLLASLIGNNRYDLMQACSELLGNITILESLAFEKLFFEDKMEETTKCFKLLEELFLFIKKPDLTKVELACLILNIAKVKQILNKKSLHERNIAKRCASLFAGKNNVPNCIELVHMFQLAILKTNLMFLTSKVIKRTGYPNFFDRLICFWQNSRTGSPNFLFGLDDDVNITRLRQVQKRLETIEEEFVFFAADIYKFFHNKNNYKFTLLISGLNDENYFDAIRLTPDHSGFCLTSIIRNLGLLEV